jgi:hypothetical protein
MYNIVSDNSIDTLELRENGTYTYKDLGDSCWLWNEFSGDWVVIENELILYRYPTKFQNFETVIQRSKKPKEYRFLISDKKLKSIYFPVKSETMIYLKE